MSRWKSGTTKGMKDIFDDCDRRGTGVEDLRAPRASCDLKGRKVRGVRWKRNEDRAGIDLGWKMNSDYETETAAHITCTSN